MAGRQYLGPACVYYFLFSSFTTAALQNVTVDDAVLTGAVVPQYLPSASAWNIGNDCLTCLVKPDSSMAYDGTWHDATTSDSQSITFTFTGSAVYIYFILANTVLGANTLTDLNFVMDGISVGSFTHEPTSSTNYQYNVPVYVNESVPFSSHSMTINPASTQNAVLMLFDYLVYTTDNTDLVTPASQSASESTSTSESNPNPSSASGTRTQPATLVQNFTASATDLFTVSSGTSTSRPTSTSQPASPTSSPSVSGTQGKTSGQNNAAIIGGVVGGATALALMAVSLLSYRRYKRRCRGNRSEGVVLVSPFPPGAAPSIPALLKGASAQVRELRPTVRLSEFQRINEVTTSPPSTPPTSTNSPSITSVIDHTIHTGPGGLVQQVELLRDEVIHLRNLHNQSQAFLDLVPQPPDPPPRYES